MNNNDVKTTNNSLTYGNEYKHKGDTGAHDVPCDIVPHVSSRTLKHKGDKCQHKPISCIFTREINVITNLYSV